MKQKIFFPLMAAGLIIFGTACKKTETQYITSYPAESAPINTAYWVTLPTTINASGSGGYEYGFKFGVTKPGKITKLACKMPTAGSYRVTLWDAGATPAVLAQATITQSAGTLTYSPLATSVALTTGKDYFVSIWSNTNWFQITPIGGGSFPYPIAQGSISIKGYSWISSATQTPIKFPTNADNTYVAGLADFEFQPDQN